MTFVVFTGCKSCTKPISTNPVSMEAGEYVLTRETWFFARRLEVVAVAGLMWVVKRQCMVSSDSGVSLRCQCSFTVLHAFDYYELLAELARSYLPVIIVRRLSTQSLSRHYRFQGLAFASLSERRQPQKPCNDSNNSPRAE